MPADTMTATSDDSFQRDVLDASMHTPVVVDFCATWCGSSRALAPMLETVVRTLGDKLALFKLDVDANKEAPATYSVTNLPTLVVFKGGQVVGKVVGNLGSAAKIQAFLDPHVAG